MAGTLVLDTLQNGAGTASTSADNVINGSAKAWVNFNGVTTATINASYNVSSITRNASGDYTINFTNALTDNKYSIGGCITQYAVGNYSSAAISLYGNQNTGPTTKTSSACRFVCLYGSATLIDSADTSLSFFR